MHDLVLPSWRHCVCRTRASSHPVRQPPRGHWCHCSWAGRGQGPRDHEQRAPRQGKADPPLVAAGRGALYGFGVFVLIEEITSRLIGIAGTQRALPVASAPAWPGRARRPGMVTELTLTAIEE